MTHLPKALLFLALLVLSACANPDRFGAGANTVDLNGQSGAGASEFGDVNSPAYFNGAIGDRVLFAVDQSTLSPEARQILTAQAGWLADNSEYAIVIEGHADERGTREYNVALSAKRANSVQQFLISQGIAASRMRTIPYGKERPLEICSDESCYTKNRRAVTVLQTAGTS